MTGVQTTRRDGFVLLEVVLALTLFGMVGVSLLIALEDIGNVARNVRREAQMTRILDSELRKWMSMPQIEEGEETADLDEKQQLEVTVSVRPLEEVVDEQRMTNMDGRLLQQMFHIEAVASWYEDDQWHEMRAETWRYARLYQQ
ncbi:MAG: hypothetical protein VCA35_00415 [Roseibacillus sp.]|mgnify:FL=1